MSRYDLRAAPGDQAELNASAEYDGYVGLSDCLYGHMHMFEPTNLAPSLPCGLACMADIGLNVGSSRTAQTAADCSSCLYMRRVQSGT